MIGRSSSPSNCRPPCIAIWPPTPRSLRKNTVRQSNPSSLCRRCSHGSCRRIVYLLAYGAQRAVPVEVRRWTSRRCCRSGGGCALDGPRGYRRSQCQVARIPRQCRAHTVGDICISDPGLRIGEGEAAARSRCPERARLTEWQSRSRLEETKRVSHLPLHALIVECESALKWDPGRFGNRGKSRGGTIIRFP